MDFGLDPGNSAVTARLGERTHPYYICIVKASPTTTITVDEEEVVGKSVNTDSGIESLFTYDKR